jgi:hypothetical protein
MHRAPDSAGNLQSSAARAFGGVIGGAAHVLGGVPSLIRPDDQQSVKEVDKRI